jgi:ribulose-phosphate 3-epimerase
VQLTKKNMSKEIIPAVLPKNFEDIETLVRRLDRLGGTIQIDLCDGKFVPTQTWPYIKGSLPEFKDDFELPGWEEFDYEIDLMIQSPELHIDNLKNLGVSRAVIHIKSTSKEGFLEACKKLESYDIEVGVGLENTSTDYSAFLKELEDSEIVYYIQVMGIDSIGKQGEHFSNKSLEFIKKIHLEYPEINIQVDGSVNEATIVPLLEAGVSRFVVGSWLSTGHAKDKVQNLKNLI